MTNLTNPHIVIISASQSDKSRSRLAAQQAQDYLVADGAMADLIHLKERNIQTYPGSNNDPELDLLVERFNAADGWVFAVPVYNWGPSGVLTNFLHYGLRDTPERRYRPFVILGGAGGQKSFLSLDGLARTLTYEINAVEVGSAILAAGDEADPERAWLHPDVKRRIERSMAALTKFAKTSPAYEHRQPNRIESGEMMAVA
ncbi:NAD(P)H-dependent oxidoreductase [Chloroflexi bacterium TSY]|nr:NAD(P)H-dependent oxidoreductase [Chloroflexi bacterium TSY]